MKVLDFSGPFDVFSMAILTQQGQGHDVPFELTTVSADGQPVRALHGLKIMPTYNIAQLLGKQIDVLFVPGGEAQDVEMFAKEHPEVLKWLQQRSKVTPVIASVCIGAGLMALAGLLEGLQVTTHHSYLERLRELAPNATVIPGVRYVDNKLPGNNVLSSAGVSSGLDLAFYLVGRLLSPEAAQATVNVMEYNGTTNWALA